MKKSGGSKIEAQMALQLGLFRKTIPAHVREYKGIPGRRFRFDFAWPDHKIYLEVEGLSSGKSRHTTITGYRMDCEKYNLAAIHGWRGIRVTQLHIRSGQAISWLEQIFRKEEGK